MPPVKKNNQKTNGRVRSLWREFEFWLMVVKSAIIPRVSIQNAVANWPTIRQNLMENSRKRRLQLDSYIAL